MAKANGVRRHWYIGESRTCDDRTCDDNAQGYSS